MLLGGGLEDLPWGRRLRDDCSGSSSRRQPRSTALPGRCREEGVQPECGTAWLVQGQDFGLGQSGGALQAHPPAPSTLPAAGTPTQPPTTHLLPPLPQGGGFEGFPGTRRHLGRSCGSVPLLLAQLQRKTPFIRHGRSVPDPAALPRHGAPLGPSDSWLLSEPRTHSWPRAQPC